MDNVTRLKLSNTVAMKVIKNDDYPVNGTTTITITMTNSQPTEVAISNLVFINVLLSVIIFLARSNPRLAMVF